MKMERGRRADLRAAEKTGADLQPCLEKAEFSACSVGSDMEAPKRTIRRAFIGSYRRHTAIRFEWTLLRANISRVAGVVQW